MCVGVNWESIPDDDDVYCSNACRISGKSRLCICKEIGNQQQMIMCDNASACVYGIWFHYACVGIVGEDIPGDILLNDIYISVSIATVMSYLRLTEIRI